MLTTQRKLRTLLLALLCAIALPASAGDDATKSASVRSPAIDGSSGTETDSSKPELEATPHRSKFEIIDDLRPRHWNATYPTTANTLLRDVGGIRSALAKKGIFIFGWSLNTFNYNLADPPNPGPQIYNGSKPTFMGQQYVDFTYDLSRIHVPNGQLDIQLETQISTYKGLQPSAMRIGRLYYHQSGFHNKVELQVGYMTANMDFYQTATAGNLTQGAMGPAGVVPFLLGASHPPFTSPGLTIRFNPTKNIYFKTGVFRSLNLLDPLQTHATSFWSSLRFHYPGTGTILTNEVQYHNPSTSDRKSTWIKAGFLANLNSTAPDYSHHTASGTPGIQKNAFGPYLYVSQQVTRPDSNLPFRGLYISGLFDYGNPSASYVSEYYEGCAYFLGPFKRRSSDFASTVVTFSRLGQDTVEALRLRGLPAKRESISSTTSYSFHVRPGVFYQVGASYITNPSYVGLNMGVTPPVRIHNAFTINTGLNLLF